MKERCVVCLNAGSSSLKFKSFREMNGGLSEEVSGQLERIGIRPRIIVRAGGAVVEDAPLPLERVPDLDHALPLVLERVRNGLSGHSIDVVGHRIVTGGTLYTDPTRVDDEVLSNLRALEHLAPLHLPSELSILESMRLAEPGLPQIAVFDTGFHRDREELFVRLPIPDEFHRAGIRRYGYHGISYEFIARQLSVVAPGIAAGRVVVAHLGSGCSMCALLDGRSIETTMSFSALDGLVMGTRPGRLDPGVVLQLLRGEERSVEEVEQMLYRKSGLLALSGESSDVRDLLSSNSPRAQHALDQFSMSCARLVAELATTLGGIDALVFTAGVGENAAPVRAAIAERLAWIGCEIDTDRNERNASLISTDASPVALYVVPTDEECMIATHSLEALPD